MALFRAREHHHICQAMYERLQSEHLLVQTVKNIESKKLFLQQMVLNGAQIFAWSSLFVRWSLNQHKNATMQLKLKHVFTVLLCVTFRKSL